MEWTCLVVDLGGSNLSSTWNETNREFALNVNVVDAAEALAMLDTGLVVAMVIHNPALEQRGTLLKLCDTYRRKVGPLPQFQAIVSQGDPDPQLLNDVFEFGIENFFGLQAWQDELVALCKSVAETIGDTNSSEHRVIQLSRSMAKGDKGGVAEAERALTEASRYDYLAAYSKGHALQAIGKFEEAAEAFRASGQMNKLFRPADTGLGENLLVLGKTDEAIALFEKLDRMNGVNVDRKASLAVAYLEKGDIAKAQAYWKEAARLEPSHPRVAEAKAQMLLVSGKINEAFDMMNNLQDVGPFFATKLNEMGIKLSQAGKGKSAIALYQRAHKIVRKELRCKISLNAALACYRMREFENALKYLARCEQEYGRKLEKVDKIRAASQAAMKAEAATKQAS